MFKITQERIEQNESEYFSIELSFEGCKNNQMLYLSTIKGEDHFVALRNFLSYYAVKKDFFKNRVLNSINKDDWQGGRMINFSNEKALLYISFNNDDVIIPFTKTASKVELEEDYTKEEIEKLKNEELEGLRQSSFELSEHLKSRSKKGLYDFEYNEMYLNKISFYTEDNEIEESREGLLKQFKKDMKMEDKYLIQKEEEISELMDEVYNKYKNFKGKKKKTVDLIEYKMINFELNNIIFSDSESAKYKITVKKISDILEDF